MHRTAGPDAAAPCWVITGPTASGKTDVALELARRRGAEIVSVDSMLVYRSMNIGTAKPTPEETAAVPHHMIDVLDPSEPCNVARFCRMASRAIDDIRGRGRLPLLVGGSPLYLKGLLWGLMEAPGGNDALREELRAEAQRDGSVALHRRLGELDPEAAERIHPNDVQRLVRALEVCAATGRGISDGRNQFSGAPVLPHRMVGLRWERAALYRRIDERVDRMLGAGLVEEVRSLSGRLGPQACQAVGYKELTHFLAGETSLDEAVRLIKRNTRRLAKHQMTWFRHFPHIVWVDADARAGGGGPADRCEALFGGSA